MAQSNEKGASYSVHHSVVTVNNGAGGGVTLGQVYPRSGVTQAAGRVVVTPLTSREASQISSAVRPHSLVNKVLIKAFVKGCKKDFKMFTIRNINTHEVTSVDKLRQVIKGQLGDEVTQNKFDVGYLQGANFVTVRNAEDLVEVWMNIQKGISVILWCDGLKKIGKSSQACRSQAISSSDSSDDDDGASKKRKKKSRNDDVEDNRKKRKKADERDKKVQDTIDLLSEKHGDKTYTPMQYRVWSEMHIGGVHSSLDNPPNSTMFHRAGSGGPRKKNHTSEIASAIGSLTNALSPKLVTPSSGSTSGSACSPAKLIDNRGKCYKQLSELKSLFESGVLTEEYTSERSVILGMLKKLV